MLRNIEILRRLKVWQKVALMAVFLGLPVPVITYLLVAEKGKALEATRIEIYGVEYLTPLKRLSKDLARHRGLVNTYLHGVLAVRSQITDVERAVDERFTAVEETDQREIAGLGQSYGTLFQTTNQLRNIKRKWETLKSKALNGQPEESFTEHTQLIAETLDLIKSVAGGSRLVLDPDFETYYLIDVVITEIPEAVENVGLLRDLAAGIAAARRTDQGELAQIATLLSQARRNVKAFEQGVTAVYRSNPGLKSRQGDLVEIGTKETESFNVLIEQQIVNAAKIEAQPLELFSAGTGAVERLLKLDETVLSDLEGLLQARNLKITGERNAILGLILLGVVMTAMTVFFIARGITRQTSEIGKLITQIESGNLNARAAVLAEDELGQTALAFNAMLDNTYGLIQSREDHDHIQHAIMKLLDEVSGVARGDLTCEAEVTADLTGAIADAFNYMIAELRQLISQVQDVTQQVTSTASETQAVTDQLVQGSQQQAVKITNTSEALDDMTVSIQQVSEDAVVSATVADQALGASRRGTEAVQNTVKGMLRIQEQVQETSRHIKQLGERSQEIGEIVQLIDEIADRTGVLALNATIQASAAGAAGQGFAVVAVEVEQLAKRSTEATKRISNLVQAIQSGTNEATAAMSETTREVVVGTKLARQAGEALSEIETVSQKLARLVQTISQASKQQAQGSANLSRSMAEIAADTQQTASGALQSAATVKSLADLADQLRASVASFKIPYEGNNGHGGLY